MYMFGRKPYPERKSCGFKNIRIHVASVDGAAAHASRFFGTFLLPSLHDYDVKMPTFNWSCGGREHKTTTFLFFS